MRIAYLCSRYPAPSLTFIQREVRALRALGLDVSTFAVRRAAPEEVLSSADREEFERTESLLPVRVGALLGAHVAALLKGPRAYLSTLRRSLGMTTGGARAALWRVFYFAEAILLWRRCERHEVRHVHAHLANVGSDVAMLAAEFGRGTGADWSWSFTMHGSTEFYDVAEHHLAEKARDARFVACVSHFTRSQMMMWVEREHWDKLHVVRCAVDLSVFAPPARNGDRGGFRVLTVSRLVLGKGVPLLLGAIAELRAQDLDAELVVVGDGPERAACEREAERLGISDSVRFTGAVGQDEIRAHYAAADAFCLPSFAEGVPVVLMEAMAMELPVVATRITGIPELVEDGENGLLVTPARSDEIAEALARLAASEPERRAMGAAGRAAVGEDFSLDRVAREKASLFAEHLKR